MNKVRFGWCLAFLNTAALAGTLAPVMPAANLPAPAAGAPVKIDPEKPTAMLLGSPQGALMLTPEMVDKIVRAQTPEYLRTIRGTPAPASADTLVTPPMKATVGRSLAAEKPVPMAGLRAASSR